MLKRVAIWVGLGIAAVGVGGLALAGVSTARGRGFWGAPISEMIQRMDAGRGAARGAVGAPSGGAEADGGSPTDVGMMGGLDGMMGGWAGAVGSASASRAGVLDSAAVRAAETRVPSGAAVDAAANRVRFTSSDPVLTVVAAPPDGRGMTFRIAGLTDPTVIVRPSAEVTVHVINGDPALPHNWLLTATAPPYGAVPAGPAADHAAVPVLPAAGPSGAAEATATFTAPASGRLYYVCAVAGHAAAGMYGSFEVGT